MSVVKAVMTKTGSVFPPLKELHAEASISSEELEKQWKAKKGKWRASRYISFIGQVLHFPCLHLQGNRTFISGGKCIFVILSTNVQISPSRTLEDGEGEFDPLLDDEDDDEGNIGRRNSRPGVHGGYNLLYIGSLKVSLFPHLEIMLDQKTRQHTVKSA